MNATVNGWESRPLAQLTSLIKDGSHGTHQDVAGGVPFLSAKDVRDRAITIPRDCRRISEHEYDSLHKKYQLQKDDILLTIVGTIGRCCRLTGEEDRFTIQRSVSVIRPSEIASSYLFHYIRSEPFQQNLKALTNASAQGGVYLASLASCLVNYPASPAEQGKIAEVLSNLDLAIQQTEALAAKQRQIKAGLVHVLLTRGIDEHGDLRSESTHAFKDSPLGRIPVAWDAVRLVTLAEFVTSGSRGWAQYYSVDGAVFLRIGNLTREHVNLRFDDVVRVTPPNTSEGRRTSVAPGDLLISITADLGIIGVIPARFEEAYVNQHIALVRLQRKKTHSRFVGWFLSSRPGQNQFERLNESGAKAGLNLPTIERLLVPITKDPDEQVRIAQVLDAATTRIDRTLQELTKLRALKTGVMQDLLTGRVRVSPLLQAANQALEKVS